jgi:pyridoxamine 5'-phosphate oxidase
MDLTDHRVSYDAERMNIADMLDDPFEQFEAWFADAEASSDPEPYSMVVSTVDADGNPRGRSVLLRRADARGFVFYTNYASAKARAMEATGVAALTFRWFDVQRQVHVEGTVERIDAAESDEYFAKRPRESQLGAWASAQSTKIESHEVLTDRLAEMSERFEGTPVPRPEFWGGYRVVPRRLEFWQGQPSRLHDRVQYDLEASSWKKSILSP